MRALLDANRAGILTPAEHTELDEYERIDHVVSLLKIRERQRLAKRE